MPPNPTQPDVYIGPTVSEYAEMRIGEIDRSIASLTLERSRFRRLVREYAGSTTLWAEHAATEADRFLPPLPEPTPAAYSIQYDEAEPFTYWASSLAALTATLRPETKGGASRVRVWSSAGVQLIDTKFGDQYDLLPK